MPAQSGPLTSSMLLNALLVLLYVCDMEMRGAFSWAAHCIFILSIFPCFGGIPLGRNPHTLCLRALRFLICSGLFVMGKMCRACRACGALGNGTKSLAHRDPVDTWEPTSQSQ